MCNSAVCYRSHPVEPIPTTLSLCAILDSIIRSLLSICHGQWSAHTETEGGRKAAEVRENKERERQTRHQYQNQLQLQTTRDQLHCRELRVWTLAANYSLSLVETKFMAPSWSCSWHHKLNWQTVLESEPTASSPEKRSRPKHCQHGCVKTPGFIIF